MNNIKLASKIISSAIQGKCPVCGGKLYYISTTLEEMKPDICKCEKCKKKWKNKKDYYIP